jgi:hypothetical protein
VTAISNVGAEVDLALQQGADFATTLTFQNQDATPVDLTGCALMAVIRRRGLDKTPVAAFALVINSPPSAGIAAMTMARSVSLGLPCGETPADPLYQFVWDLKLTDSAGKVSVPLFGAVTVQREVSR